jgi:hypothetical protein
MSWKKLVDGKVEENRSMETFQALLIKGEIIQFEEKHKIAFYGF